MLRRDMARMTVQYTRIVRVGVDLAQSVVQVHAVDESGAVLVAKQLQRSAFIPWCEQLPSGCIVAMEACTTAHYWGRRLLQMGLTARLLSPAFVAPYRMSGKTGKNDANDAAAICEAASRPHMRFVPVKSPTQQGWLALHTLRDGYIRERTACMNRVRGVLREFGVSFPVSTTKFRSQLLDVLADKDSELTPLARTALRRCFTHFQAVERQILWCNKQIERHVASDANATLAMSVSGVGVLGASALAASLGDLSQFANGRKFGAWLGLVPRLNSSAGKQSLGRITKRGNSYLRKLLVLGARSALYSASNRDDPVSRWAAQLRDRVGPAKAAVALANKNARALWNVLSKKVE